MSYLSGPYETILEWCKLDEWFNLSPAYESGLLAGVSITVIGILAALLLRFILTGSKKEKGIHIAGEKGEMTITLNAVREFVKRTLQEVQDVNLENVKLRQCRNALVLSMQISVTPEAQLVQLRDNIQDRIVANAERYLGLPMPVKVNIAVKSLESGQGKHSRRKTEEESPASETEG
ncbi:MAG: alkaline shock response membrane anchor protein AmaP [Verrucomicrobiota bacterium]